MMHCSRKTQQHQGRRRVHCICGKSKQTVALRSVGFFFNKGARCYGWFGLFMSNADRNWPASAVWVCEHGLKDVSFTQGPTCPPTDRQLGHPESDRVCSTP